jgi:hypothetical protein
MAREAREPTEGKDYAICPHCGCAMCVGSRACRVCWRDGLADQAKYRDSAPRVKGDVIDVTSNLTCFVKRES